MFDIVQDGTPGPTGDFESKMAWIRPTAVMASATYLHMTYDALPMTIYISTNMMFLAQRTSSLFTELVNQTGLIHLPSIHRNFQTKFQFAQGSIWSSSPSISVRQTQTTDVAKGEHYYANIQKVIFFTEPYACVFCVYLQLVKYQPQKLPTLTAWALRCEICEYFISLLSWRRHAFNIAFPIPN